MLSDGVQPPTFLTLALKPCLASAQHQSCQPFLRSCMTKLSSWEVTPFRAFYFWKWWKIVRYRELNRYILILTRLNHEHCRPKFQSSREQIIFICNNYFLFAFKKNWQHCSRCGIGLSRLKQVLILSHQNLLPNIKWCIVQPETLTFSGEVLTTSFETVLHFLET